MPPFTRDVRHALGTAASASILVGHLAQRHRVTAQVAELAAAGDLPVVVLSMAKGAFPEASPQFAGLYTGAASAKRARLAVEDTDLLITVGVTLGDTVTGGGTHQLPTARCIDLAPDSARIGSTAYPGVGLGQALAALPAAVRASQLRVGTRLIGSAETPPAATVQADPAAPLTHQQAARLGLARQPRRVSFCAR